MQSSMQGIYAKAHCGPMLECCMKQMVLKIKATCETLHTEGEILHSEAQSGNMHLPAYLQQLHNSVCLLMQVGMLALPVGAL